MFPTLKTGAVMQYPGKRVLQFCTDVVRFLDGTEQRYRDYARYCTGGPSNSTYWMNLNLPSTTNSLYLTRARSETFSFTDPWDGTVYANCSLAADTFAFTVTGEMRGATTVTVCENRT